MQFCDHLKSPRKLAQVGTQRNQTKKWHFKPTISRFSEKMMSDGIDQIRRI